MQRKFYFATAILSLMLINAAVAQSGASFVNSSGDTLMQVRDDGRVIIGAAVANGNAVLDVDAINNDKGILIPRLSSAQRTAIGGLGASDEGLLVYDETSGSFWFWSGSQWNELGSAGGGNSWGLTGNAGTVDGTNFLGTTDNVGIDFRVNNSRALRLEYAEPWAGKPAPNVIGGASGNTVSAGVFSATIAGGGNTDSGQFNKVEAYGGTVGGGINNTASGSSAVVGGGAYNTASGSITATVSGGFKNAASGSYATVPGGSDNKAGGNYSFAAGRRATIAATHSGAFLFSDGNDFDFNSAAANEFAARATGGVRFVTAINGSGNPTQTVSINNAGTVTAAAFVGDGSGLTNLPSGNGWNLTGNAGTDTTTNFIGTTDNMPLDFKVNNTRALRLEYAENTSGDPTPKVIGGFSGNTISAAAYGSTISGGGVTGFPNFITAPSGTIGGGLKNTVSGIFSTIGGGSTNTANGASSTIGGGINNTAQGWYSTIGGGWANSAGGLNSIVGGGQNNTAGGLSATVSGGGGSVANVSIGNSAGGSWSSVPGGALNSAGGDYSFAAGRRATIAAAHDGAFLFSDGNDFDFNSAAANEFAARATGGVRFVTAIDGSGNPTQTVSINNAGTVTAAAFAGDGSGLTNLPTSNGWRLTGNAGTDTTTNFIGTTDNMPLDFKVNNLRALRLTPTTYSSNMIGGYSGNFIANSVQGATIAGGGESGSENSITANYSFIGAGRANSAGGYGSFIGGGSNNYTSGVYSSSGGGNNNNVTGDRSTVPGGGDNTASGSDCFAAGRYAVAQHNGTFVWASGSGFFSSTAANQFLIRAAGGVGINKNNPTTALDVDGTVTATAFAGDGSGLTGITVPGDNLGDHTATQALNLNGNYLSGDGDSEGVFVNGSGNVGIATASPEKKFHVNGAAQIQNGSLYFSTLPAANLSHAESKITATLSGGPTADPIDQNIAFEVSDGSQFGSTEVMRLRGDGKVGIGTNTPANTLSVSGDVDFTGSLGVGTNTPHSSVQVNGSFATKVTVTSSSLTLDDSHSIVIRTGVLPATITLPSASGIAGRLYTIKNAGTGVTIAAQSGETVDGAASITLTAIPAYQFRTVVSDGSNWYVVGSN